MTTLSYLQQCARRAEAKMFTLCGIAYLEIEKQLVFQGAALEFYLFKMDDYFL